MDLRINLKILPSLSKKPSGRAVKTLLKGMEFVSIVWLLIVNILIFVLMLWIKIRLSKKCGVFLKKLCEFYRSLAGLSGF